VVEPLNKLESRSRERAQKLLGPLRVGHLVVAETGCTRHLAWRAEREGDDDGHGSEHGRAATGRRRPMLGDKLADELVDELTKTARRRMPLTGWRSC